MYSITRMGGCIGILALSLGVSLASAEDKVAVNSPSPERTTVDIGMPKTLFQGMPQWIIEAGAAPFRKMMKSNTGVDGTIQFPANAMLLATDLNAGKVQIGVMQGHEYGWAKSKYPDLYPIVIAVPMQPSQSYCLVKWDSTAKDIGDLKAEKVSLPPIHRDYCDLYLTKLRDKHLKSGFAGQISAPLATDAIQDVIEERAGCTFIDCATLKFFENVYPGQFKNLKVLCQSEIFPNACIVVKKGELDDKTIDKFVKALLNAQSDSTGRPMLATWKLKGFAKVPADYEQQVQAIGKAYPITPAMQAALEK